jgi:hypothetical protein
MRLVRAVPAQSMVSSRELHVFECGSCQRTEQRLVLTHTIEPLPGERMQLPSLASPAVTAATHKVSLAARNAWMHTVPMFHAGFSSASALLASARHQGSVAACNAWLRTAPKFRDGLASASTLLTSARHKGSVAWHKASIAARSAWARTVAMVRGHRDDAS